MDYYPNACIVCSATINLKRCSRCQMVSYCNVLHQKKHWPEHKDLCGVICTMMMEKGVKHLFEKFRGLEKHKWRKERLTLMVRAEDRLGRQFKINDEYLFKFPRACFVCHESRQTLLKNCPGCPSASFCKQHPSSMIHDEDCAKIQKFFDIGVKFHNYPIFLVQLAITSFLLKAKPFKTSKQPASMEDFIFEFANRDKIFSDIPAEVKYYFTDLFSIMMTLYGALQKLEYRPTSELLIHLQGPIECASLWEIFLHIFPEIKVLRILITDIYTPANEDYKESDLCPNCTKQGKKMIVDFMDFTKYLETNYEKPDVLICTDRTIVSDEEFVHETMKNLLKTWGRLNCPLIITSLTMECHKVIKGIINSTLGISQVFFDGLNAYKSLVCTRNLDDGRIGLPNEYMFILKPKSQTEEKPANKISSQSGNKISKNTKNFFNASICHVCGLSKASVTCNQCKMISYCGKDHQDEHQAEHDDLCKVILELLNENGAPNLFDKLKTKDSNLWLRAKLHLMSKARSKLGREFLDFEKQMFLFPKTCFICHESDLSVLKNCECRVTFCETHIEDREHKNICENLSLAFKFSINERPEVLKTSIKKLNRETNGTFNLSSSMKDYVDFFLHFEKEISMFDVSNLEKFLISEFLTRPLTFLWSLEKLELKNESSLVVHVVGATNSEISAQKYWKIVLYEIQKLKSLNVSFIGPEISNASLLESELEFPVSSLVGKNLEVKTHSMKYEEYAQSDFFIKPDVIVGFNLHFHESEFEFVNYNWKDMISTLRNVKAPFILTAGSESRAQKDHEIVCQFSGKIVDFICNEENPFAGLIPERDFETEKVIFSNQHLIIYEKLC